MIAMPLPPALLTCLVLLSWCVCACDNAASNHNTSAAVDTTDTAQQTQDTSPGDATTFSDTSESDLSVDSVDTTMDTAAIDTAAMDTAAIDTAAMDTAAMDTAAIDTAAMDTAAMDTAADTAADVFEDTAVSCPTGLILCGQECVDTTNDALHCGSCDETCPTFANAQSQCEAGSCLATCEADFVDCEGDTLTMTSVDGCETSASIGCKVIERVSLSGSMSEANGSSLYPEISADGRYVVFLTSGTNLVGDMPLGALNIVLRDRALRQNYGINRDELGTLQRSALAPYLSDDGNLVVFSFPSDVLLASDTNGFQDVFLRDRSNATTQRISVDTNGEDPNDQSSLPYISPDGRYVLFSTRASDIILSPISNGHDQIVLFDRANNTYEFISVTDAGVLGNGNSMVAGLSDDGRFIAFRSGGSNFVENDTNALTDVFVRDRTLGTTVRVSLTYQGFESSGAAMGVAFSRDGRYVVWSSSASDLVPDDTNNKSDVFLRDLLLETTERISVDSAGNQSTGSSGGRWQISVSGDGRLVVFLSSSDDLVLNDTNTYSDIFLRDRALGTTTRVNVSETGEESNSAITESPRITPDGRYITFSSRASNLVPNDTNGHDDIFVVRLLSSSP